jgi:hypothetical protein
MLSGRRTLCSIAQLGALFAVATLLLWIAIWGTEIIRGKLQPQLLKLFGLYLVVILLANNGQLLATCTFGAERIINSNQ